MPAGGVFRRRPRVQLRAAQKHRKKLLSKSTGVPSGSVTFSAQASVATTGERASVGSAAFEAEADVAAVGARASQGQTSFDAEADYVSVGDNTPPAILQLDMATEGNQALELTKNVLKLDIATESNLALPFSIGVADSFPDLDRIDDWITAPPDWGQWGGKLNEWMQDLVDIVRILTDNTQREGSLLWSKTYTIRFTLGSNTTLSPLPLILGNADDAPRFDFPTTLKIDALGQHGVNTIANATVLWQTYDEYNGPESDADEGTLISFPWSDNYNDLGIVTFLSPWHHVAAKELQAGEQAQWATGYAIDQGSHSHYSLWHVGLYRGHIL